MNGDAPISWLMFFTLAAAFIVAAGFFLHFLRSRHNRAVASTAIGGEQDARGAVPDGAGAELAGLLAVALVAMALLTLGYHSHGGSASNAQPVAGHADSAPQKPVRPQTPSPDTRSAPTGSSTGIGPDSGGHPEATPKQ